MNTVSLQELTKTEAKKSGFDTSFFFVEERAKKGTFKVIYQDSGHRSTRCTDCPSRLIVCGYVDSAMTGYEIQRVFDKMVEKIQEHYRTK